MAGWRWWLWWQWWWEGGHEVLEQGVRRLQRVEEWLEEQGLVKAWTPEPDHLCGCYRGCRRSCCGLTGCWLRFLCPAGQGTCLGPTRCCSALLPRWGACMYREVGLEGEPSCCWLQSETEERKKDRGKLRSALQTSWHTECCLSMWYQNHKTLLLPLSNSAKTYFAFPVHLELHWHHSVSKDLLHHDTPSVMFLRGQSTRLTRKH